MPTIYTQPGGVAFAAGKSMGQIEREKESYTRGVEEARLEMQKQQIDDARKMREIAQAFQEEQAILQQLQFEKTQEFAREKMEQTKELAVLGHKEAMERAKLGDVGATKRTELGQAGATGRTELQQEGATERAEMQRISKEKNELAAMKRRMSQLDKEGWEKVTEGANVPKGSPSFIDEHGQQWYKPEKSETREKRIKEWKPGVAEQRAVNALKTGVLRTSKDGQISRKNYYEKGRAEEDFVADVLFLTKANPTHKYLEKYLKGYLGSGGSKYQILEVE